MKNLFFTTAIAMLLSFTTSDWKPVKLNDRIQVSMPGTPLEETLPNGMVKKKVKMDDGGELGGMIIEYSKYGLTTETLKQMTETDEFVNQMKQSLASQGATVISVNKGEYKKMKYFELDVEVEKEGKKSFSTIRNVIVEDMGVNLVYKYGSKGPDKAIKDQYFSSLEIK